MVSQLQLCAMKYMFTFLDDNHNQVLSAHSNCKGAYICSAEDLVAAFGNREPIRVLFYWADAPQNLNSSLELRSFMMKTTNREPLRPKKYFSRPSNKTEEMKRANYTIGHPSDNKNNGNLVSTRLTCQDIRNAKLLFRPCIPCLPPKLKAPSEKPTCRENKNNK